VSAPLSWRAVWIGAAVSIAVSVLMLFLCAGALAAVVGFAITLPGLFGSGYVPDGGWWLQVVVWSLAGVALAFVGGALGAQSRRA